MVVPSQIILKPPFSPLTPTPPLVPSPRLPKWYAIAKRSFLASPKRVPCPLSLWDGPDSLYYQLTHHDGCHLGSTGLIALLWKPPEKPELGHHFSDCVIGVSLLAIVTPHSSVVVETSFLSRTYFKHFRQDAFVYYMYINIYIFSTWAFWVICYKYSC